MDELEIIHYPQINGLNVFVNTMTYRTPHFHREWELLWALDAPLAVTCKNKHHILKPGEAALFPPNVTHELCQVTDICTFLCFQISPSLISDTAGISLDDIRLCEHLSQEDYLWVHRASLDIAREYFLCGPFYELYCSGQCGLLLHRLLSNLPIHRLTAEETAQIDSQNARLFRLTQFIEKNYMHKIRLADFAEQEGCSVSYLSHFIKDTMNLTFQEYVNTVRFNRACKMIADGNDSMISVSVEAGFSDYRYFSRAFKKAYGMTPAEYSRNTQLTALEDHFHTHSRQSQEQFLTRSQSIAVLNRFIKEPVKHS